MKALSIRQPWAWGILHAGKDIENRTWPTKIRGEILIHASLVIDAAEWAYFVDTSLLARKTWPDRIIPELPMPKQIERGGIVGIAEIADCVSESRSPWFFGPYGFFLKNARPLPFRPFKGKLGFFEVPDLN